MPFVHPERAAERGIERGLPAETSADTATHSAPPFLTTQPGSIQDAARPAAADKLDLDDLAERVMRRLARSLAVERERLGGPRWP